MYSEKKWWQKVDLSYNPFAILESSSDRFILNYMVGNQANEYIWGNWPSFIFSPEGGGKTALVIRFFHASWMMEVPCRPFPIPFTIPYLDWIDLRRPNLCHYKSAMTDQGIYLLCFYICSKSDWFLNLDKYKRKEIVRELMQLLPDDDFFSFSPEISGESFINLLKSRFSAAYLSGMSYKEGHCEEITNLMVQNASCARIQEPNERWDRFTSLLLDLLQFPAIYIYFDGLDSTPSSAMNPEYIINKLEAIFTDLEKFCEKKIFLKFFMPDFIQEKLTNYVAMDKYPNSVNKIYWDEPLLSDLVRRRLYMASNGYIGGMSTIAAPVLDDIELKIAREVRKLPRDMLFVCNHLLESVFQTEKNNERIKPSNIQETLSWYKNNLDLILGR